jgi:hypothetical protein
VEVKRPIGIVGMLAIMSLILIVEPALRWFLLPTMLLGAGVAFLLQRSGSRFLDETSRASVGI